MTFNAYQKTRNGTDGFIMKIKAYSGEYSVEYSTYLGGRGDDSINDISLDIHGNLYLTGLTGSDNFPVTYGAHDSSLSGVDAFVMKFSAPKSVLYSSYLGGIEADQGYAVAVDRYQNIYVAGKTWSSNFTVTPDACKEPHRTLRWLPDKIHAIHDKQHRSHTPQRNRTAHSYSHRRHNQLRRFDRVVQTRPVYKRLQDHRGLGRGWFTGNKDL
ncbi:hypothetical protein DNK57_03680 [Methanothermobacter thermautotrophicus]|uniref:Beta-propeller repeat protein n=1 Tax=Methanothermobacter thermautotrophicus TaxID=145262 RepID=A0A842YKQ8_METTF|nr:hypothetical protein [Methanothermobacter thermautotrophicus]